MAPDTKKTKPKTTAVKSAAVKPVVKKESGLEVMIYDLTGVKKTPAKVSKDIFGKKVSDKLLATYVRVYLTNQRQNNAASKTRAEITGSTKKIYKQKGTGRARHGAKSAPIFVGGGVAFGPQPYDTSSKLNKKQKKAALFGALTKAYEADHIIGLSDEAVSAKSKTKDVAKFLQKLDLVKKKTLLVFPKLEKNNLVLSSRNIPNVTVMDAQSLNTYAVLSQEKIVFVKNALVVMEKHFLNS